jgi:type IV pilus assembly protein PilE
MKTDNKKRVRILRLVQTPEGGLSHPKGRLRLRAMTLTELLVVLAILGILMLLAIPGYQFIFQDTHAKEAELGLTTLCNQQKIYRLEHAKYATDLKKARFQQEPLVTEENGRAHYKIEIVRGGNNDFLARATAVTDFDGDGIFNLWEIDQNCIPKEVVED